MRSEQVWARVLASFLLPGLGQALTGRRMRAIVWGIAGFVAVVAIAWSIWMLYLGIALRLAAAGDAYVCTRKPAASSILATVTSSVLGGLGLVYFLVGFEAFRAPSTSMLPTIAQGDKLYVEVVSKHVRDVGRGEVIVFHQPCSPNRDYLKRVVAVAGDTIEVRCGVIYVNGKAVPAELVAAERTYHETDGRGERFPRQVSVYRETLGDTTYEIYDETGRPNRHDQRDDREYPHDRARSCRDAGDAGLGESEPNPAQPALAVVVTKQYAAACELRAHVVVPPGTLFVMGDNRDNSNDSRFWGVVPVDLVVGRVVGVWAPLGRIGDL